LSRCVADVAVVTRALVRLPGPPCRPPSFDLARTPRGTHVLRAPRFLLSIYLRCLRTIEFLARCVGCIHFIRAASIAPFRPAPCRAVSPCGFANASAGTSCARERRSHGLLLRTIKCTFTCVSYTRPRRYALARSGDICVQRARARCTGCALIWQIRRRFARMLGYFSIKFFENRSCDFFSIIITQLYFRAWAK